jgi:hypothetical protein
MRRFLNKLMSDFRSTEAARSARRAPRRAGLQVESLERREVLSVSSLLPHAVTGPASDPTIERVFYIDKSDRGVHFANADDQGDLVPSAELNPVGQGPQNVVAISAGHGANGDNDVFAEGGDGSLWEYTIGVKGWKEVLGSHQVKSFAAVDGGRAFAIFSDGTLHQYTNAAGWSQLPTSGTVTEIDAVTDKFGHDTVYVLNGNDTFGEFTYLPALRLPGSTAAMAKTATIITSGGEAVSLLQPYYTQLLPAGHFFFGGRTTTFSEVTNFSAGSNASGYADVYATSWLGGLEQNLSNTPTGWVSFAARGTFTAYSAIDQGQVWIQGPNQVVPYSGAPAGPGVVLYAPNGSTAQIPGGYGVAFAGQNISISGVGAGGEYSWGLFTVDQNGNLSGFSYDPAWSYPVHQTPGPNGIHPYLG